jgi:hypothetical protein
VNDKKKRVIRLEKGRIVHDAEEGTYFLDEADFLKDEGSGEIDNSGDRFASDPFANKSGVQQNSSQNAPLREAESSGAKTGGNANPSLSAAKKSKMGFKDAFKTSKNGSGDISKEGERR